MNELDVLFNRGDISDCQVLDTKMRCPTDNNKAVWCSECIFCNSTQANIKVKELIPILIIEGEDE